MVTNMTLTLYVGHTVEHSVTSGTVVKWNIRGEGIVRQLWAPQQVVVCLEHFFLI